MEAGKVFFDLELEKYRGEVTLTGNLGIKESCNIKVSDLFFKEILENCIQKPITKKRFYRIITFGHCPCGMIHL